MDEILYPFFLSVSKNLLGLARPQKASNFSFFIFGSLVALIFDLITGMLKDLNKSFSFFSLSPVNIILSISLRPRSIVYYQLVEILYLVLIDNFATHHPLLLC